MLAPNLAAQDVSGPARASDGDTLNLTDISLRPYGIERPGAYRAAHAALRRQSAPPAGLRRGAPSPAPSGIYYRGRNEARAASAAPLYRGQPGDRPEMDGDGDGIACEPYRDHR